MNKQRKQTLITGICTLSAFLLWTILVKVVDVQPVAPQGTSVGFATLNTFFHRLTGVHMGLYDLTDLLSLIPLGIVLGFAILGLWQWIRRKSLLKVDRSILVLGILYALTGVVFVVFEKLVINYRPILIEGQLEASYPSSTTLLVICVMTSATLQLNRRISHPVLRPVVSVCLGIFTGFMVIGRLISGVHWLTDIIGGALLSVGLVLLYHSFAQEEK